MLSSQRAPGFAPGPGDGQSDSEEPGSGAKAAVVRDTAERASVQALGKRQDSSGSPSILTLVLRCSRLKSSQVPVSLLLLLLF